MPGNLVSYPVGEQEGSGPERFWQGCVCVCVSVDMGYTSLEAGRML